MTNKTSDYDLTVIVPVYNERGNMLRLESALAALGYLLFFICDHLRRKIYGKKI